MKSTLILITACGVLALINGVPVPARSRNPFDHEEVVVPVPIVYSAEDSFENILNTGSYRFIPRSSEEVKTSQKKATAVSTLDDEEDDDDDDEPDVDDDTADDGDTATLKDIEDAMKDKGVVDELDDDVDFLNEGSGPLKLEVSNDDDDDDDDDEDEEDDGENEAVTRERKQRYLFDQSGINESYGWYGWPNERNNHHHHSHNHHHHHQPTYHHGFYTSYF